MKQYNRHKSAAEVLLHCAITKVVVDDSQYVPNDQYLFVFLPGRTGDTIPVMYNTADGDFCFGEAHDEPDQNEFSSKAAPVGEAWFDAMVDFFMTDLPPLEDLPVTLQLSEETVRNLFAVAANCCASHAINNGATSHGELDIVGLITMLAKDAAMTSSRPGSWEGANMAQVLSSHGYN